ncbi:MAG: hypothetical protein SVP26_11100 [Chloroflexota bacterium]|nr:hypothetical protein [Chloroflexota bacterium]
MTKHLPGELLRFLATAGEVAHAQGRRLYLVGGAVRDLLLGRSNLDYDLVVEGDATLLARQLARASGDKARVHARFGTATFRHGDVSIDVATARRETYSRPGALPDVTPGGIADDLFRRDFSINAMAIDLTLGSFGRLLDPFAGRDDLNHRLIRVLHDRSFIDDATRILRALRYEQRLGFKLEKATETLLRQGTSMLDTISGDRVRRETELNLQEEHPERILARAEELGVLKAVHPALKGDGWLDGKLREASRVAPADTDLFTALLTYNMTAEQSEQVMDRLNIQGGLRRSIMQVHRLKEAYRGLAAPDLPPSRVFRLLHPYSATAVSACAIACDCPAVRKRLEHYLVELRHVTTCLDGDDLKELGVEPGPGLGRVLRALLDAKLDGRVSTRQGEEVLVRQWLADGKGAQLGRDL